MTAQDTGKTVGRRSLLAASAIMIAVFLLVFAFSGLEGPASRCEGAGGQMLVGPGGETSCVNERNFLPLEGFEDGLKAP